MVHKSIQKLFVRAQILDKLRKCRNRGEVQLTPPTICLKSGSSSEDQEGQVSHVGGFVPLLCEELLVCRGNRRLPDSSRSFVWRVPCGVWRVACCVRRVACGVWRVTCGVWRGRNKDKDMDRDNDMDCKLGIVMHTFQRALCCFHDGGLCFPSV